MGHDTLDGSDTGFYLYSLKGLLKAFGRHEFKGPIFYTLKVFFFCPVFVDCEGLRRSLVFENLWFS